MKQLFDWRTSETSIDGMFRCPVTSFIDCRLRVNIGEFKAGTQVERISVCFATGRLHIQTNAGALLADHRLEVNITP